MKSKMLIAAIAAILLLLVSGYVDAIEKADPGRQEEINIAEGGAWKDSVKVAGEQGMKYEKPIVRYDASGTVIIAYKYRNASAKLTEIHLRTYDGEKFDVLGDINVSQTPNMTSYEPDMVVTPEGYVHVAWAEYSKTNHSNMHLMHRWWNGSEWSNLQSFGSIDAEHIEDIHLAVDPNNNPHIAFMIWPRALTYQASLYNGQAKMVRFPENGRSKHADIGADGNFVYVVWQYNLSGRYTIQYAKRQNSLNGTWVSSEGIVSRHNCARPRMFLDENGTVHVTYYEEGPTGSNRRLWYLYSTDGNSFSSRRNIMDTQFRLFHYCSLTAVDGHVAVCVQEGASRKGRHVMYNKKSSGSWGSMYSIPGVSGPTHTSIALSPDGETTVMVYMQEESAIYLLANGDITGGLQAEFNPPGQVFWGGSNAFDASQCAALNPGETIAEYRWDFGDGSIETTTEPIIGHEFQAYGHSMTVRLEITSASGKKGMIQKSVFVHALFSATITTVNSKRIRTLFYDRPANEIFWQPNQKNVDAGYPAIVRYQVYRAPYTSSIDESSYVLLGEVDASVTDYLDYAGVSEDTSYQYAVRSVDSEGHISPLNNL